MSADERHLLTLPDVTAWSAWLVASAASSDGVWLVLAKKGTMTPTSVRYQEALEEALGHGWIDGQRRGHTDDTFIQRFTPRRPRSLWSKRNVEIIERLEAEGRLYVGGRAEVERAKEDGRWERAYAGQASAEVPRELALAFAERPTALAAFEALGASDRYSALHPILSAPNPATLARRIERLITRLGTDGEAG